MHKTPLVVIKGAGEMASGVAHRLHRAGIARICMIEVAAPTSVRRSVSFSEAVYLGKACVEGVTGELAHDVDSVSEITSRRNVAVLVDPEWRSIDSLAPTIVVDAILAKRNLGTTITDADLVIGLGPGFCAGRDVHYVIETNRGHDLGRIIRAGFAAPNTGVPGTISGHSADRVLRAPGKGTFTTNCEIGDIVEAGETIGRVVAHTAEGTTDRSSPRPVQAGVSGVIRGLIRDGTAVASGQKIGDVDPRGEAVYCDTISDKARTISGAVLEIIVGKVCAPR